MPIPTTPHRASDSDSDGGSEGEGMPSHEDYAQFPRDGSPDSVQELEPDEFPTYFDERNGRLFHASLTSPYPLPVDAGEQERLNALHTLVKDMIGGNYVPNGPVAQKLAPEPDNQKHVLDLCHGTGKWVMEMAAKFPRVLFTGIDHVPIATRYPLPNVEFEVGDICAPLRWENPHFNLVHARDIALSVRDYRTILPEVARVLLPGGIFFSGEWELRVRHTSHSQQSANGTHNDPCPSSTLFYQMVNAAIQSLGIVTDISLIPDYLGQIGLFDQIQSNSFFVPVGAWANNERMADMGEKFLAIQTRFADSVKPLLRDAGNSEQAIDTLVSNFVHEISSTGGLMVAYHYVHARRI